MSTRPRQVWQKKKAAIPVPVKKKLLRRTGQVGRFASKTPNQGLERSFCWWIAGHRLLQQEFVVHRHRSELALPPERSAAREGTPHLRGGHAGDERALRFVMLSSLTRRILVCEMCWGPHLSPLPKVQSCIKACALLMWDDLPCWQTT